MICWGVQAQEGFDAKMRRAGLVDVLAVDSTLRVKLMYSAPDNFMRRDVYGDLETAYLLPHFARKVAAAHEIIRGRVPDGGSWCATPRVRSACSGRCTSWSKVRRIRCTSPTERAADAITTALRSM